MAFPLPSFAQIPVPQRLVIPIPGEATTWKAVDRGTQVNAGQSLTTPPGVVAPVGGTAGDVIDLSMTCAQSLRGIALETKAEAPEFPVDAPVPEEGRRRAVDTVLAARPADLPAWIGRFSAAGIWADRRDCPSFHDQLLTAPSAKCDTLLCTILDSDPTLPLNYALSLRYGDALIVGAALLARIVGAPRTLLVTESRLAPSQLCTGPAADFGIRITAIRNDYPQSDPTLLLHHLLNRHLRPGHLPTQESAFLVDAPLAVAVGLLLLRDLPMLRVPFALRDHVRNKSHLLWACPGTRLGDVLEGLGIPPHHALLRAGDILRDLRCTVDSVIAGGELTAHLTTAPGPNNPDPCIRCSWCHEACPTRVQPAMLLEAAQREDLELAGKFGLDACIECGLCSYLCPSRLPLLPSIRRLKRLDRQAVSR